METKKLSKTARRRLKKKGIIATTGIGSKLDDDTKEKPQNNEKTETAVIEETPSEPSKSVKTGKRKREHHPEQESAVNVKTANEPAKSTKTNKRQRKNHPENKVIYINKNYGTDDPNGIGGLMQAELLELRKQSSNIKTASDLTESQTHVIKRQITRLQGAEKERVFKRAKHYDKTIAEAAKELQQLLAKRKSKPATTSGKRKK